LDGVTAKTLADAVDGDDEVVTFFVFLLLGGEQFQLGRGERQPITDQA
jgi:hypothetical protein